MLNPTVQFNRYIRTVNMANVEEKFHEAIMNLLDNNRSSNNSIRTREIYAETTSNVKEAKLNTTKTSLQRYLLRKYDVLEVTGIEKLIRKGDGIFSPLG
jgi:hypothetical protein